MAIIMIYINITRLVLINELGKYHNMIEMCRLKNVVIFIQTVPSFVLSRKIQKKFDVYLTYTECPAKSI